jgi:hypothetical protein
MHKNVSTKYALTLMSRSKLVFRILILPGVHKVQQLPIEGFFSMLRHTPDILNIAPIVDSMTDARYSLAVFLKVPSLDPCYLKNQSNHRSLLLHVRDLPPEHILEAISIRNSLPQT